MERHNIIQFLENDTRKEDPAGYEKHLRNLFDPVDDVHPVNNDEVAGASYSMVGSEPPAKRVGTGDAHSTSDEVICAKRGCCKKPRFDSLFCSDSCGVSELERDLLRTMYIAGELHPSVMRT